MEMFLELYLLANPKSNIDIYFGIGGGPEGVLAALL